MRPKASRASSPNPTANLVGSRKGRPANAAEIAAFVILALTRPFASLRATLSQRERATLREPFSPWEKVARSAG